LINADYLVTARRARIPLHVDHPSTGFHVEVEDLSNNHTLFYSQAVSRLKKLYETVIAIFLILAEARTSFQPLTIHHWRYSTAFRQCP
jgi:hypothetical protein